SLAIKDPPLFECRGAARSARTHVLIFCVELLSRSPSTALAAPAMEACTSGRRLVLYYHHTPSDVSGVAKLQLGSSMNRAIARVSLGSRLSAVQASSVPCRAALWRPWVLGLKNSVGSSPSPLPFPPPAQPPF